MSTSFNSNTLLDQQTANILNINPARHRTYESIIKCFFNQVYQIDKQQSDTSNNHLVSADTKIPLYEKFCGLDTSPLRPSDKRIAQDN
ncbi:32434_t:CDS:2 [Gigaspora margarita]|uniref:32434_t:CDS:1 n=1 Tax=Gigaspora margarita TaxID=4874 RepID=A0ABN7UFG1_GIGMA|nr:32434_t:CDS:2 [Gigaspora margarita]